MSKATQADPYDLSGDVPPIVTIYFFHSPSCESCHQATPILEAWAVSKNLPVISRNVAADENASIDGWDWTGTPAYALSVNGKLAAKPHAGGMTKTELDRWFKASMEKWEKGRGR